MLSKSSRHLVLQFLQARRADWHKGSYDKWLAITVVKLQNSGIYAEFGPCSFWSSTSYIFFQPICSKSLQCSEMFLISPCQMSILQPHFYFVGCYLVLIHKTLHWRWKTMASSNSPQSNLFMLFPLVASRIRIHLQCMVGFWSIKVLIKCKILFR